MENIKEVSPKTVKNRLSIIKNILFKRNLDGLVLIFAYDSNNNINTIQCFNWLFFGLSGKKMIEENPLPFEFNETFIIISQSKLFIFSLKSTKDFFYKILSEVDEFTIEYCIPTKLQENDSEKLQNFKITKFIENTYNLKSLGFPLQPKEKRNIIEIEKWPLINACGLDVLGEGFFTLKHPISDISEDLEELYSEIDVTAIKSLIYDCVKGLQITFREFSTFYDNDQIENRLSKSEEALNETSELNFLYLEYSRTNQKFEFLNDLPEARFQVGKNTNSDFSTKSSTNSLQKIEFDYRYPSFHSVYENFDPITGIRFARTFFLTNLSEDFIDYNDTEDQLIYHSSRVFSDAQFLAELYFILIRLFKTHQFDLLASKIEQKHFVSLLLNELNQLIISEYDRYDHVNKNKLEFYLIKEENVLLNVNKYKIMKKNQSSLNYTNNHISVLRIQINNIYSMKENRLIGGITFCDSYLNSFEEVFCLTEDISISKFWLTSYLHFYDRKHLDYEIFSKMNKLQKEEINIKMTDIKFKGALFYNDSYNYPLSFSNENFIGLCASMTLMKEYIYITDKSLGPIIFQHSNIEEIAFREDLKFLIIFIFFKESNGLPMSRLITNEFLIILPNNQIKNIKNLIMSYFKTNFSCGTIDDKNYMYEKIVDHLCETNEINGEYSKNDHLLEKLKKKVNDYFYYEKFLIESQFTLMNYNQFTDKFNTKIKINDGDKVVRLIPIFGSINSNVEYFSHNLYLAMRNQFYNVKIVKSKEYSYSIDEFNEEIYNYLNDKKNEKYLILEIKFEISISEYLDILVNSFKGNFWDCFSIVNICCSLNYFSLIQNENKNFFNQIQNIKNPDLCQIILVDEAEVSSSKVNYYSLYISHYCNKKAIVFNKRSFTNNLKEVRKIYTEYGFDIRKYQFSKEIIKNRVNWFEGIEHIFFPFNFEIDKNLFEDYIIYRLSKPIKHAIEIQEKKDSNEKEIKTKFYMKDYDFITDLVANVNLSKTLDSHIIIDKINGYGRFIGEPNISKIKTNYKLLVYLEASKDITKENMGFTLIGKNLKKNYNIIVELFNHLSCFEFKIPQRIPHRKFESLTEEEIQKVNLSNLWNGDIDNEEWEMDGPIYVDKSGVRTAFHPKINQYLQDYLNEINKQIDEKNIEIDKQVQDLLILK